MPKRKRKNAIHKTPVDTVRYHATIAKYRRLRKDRLKTQDPEDVPIDNEKAQAELLELLEETKPLRLRANSLLRL